MKQGRSQRKLRCERVRFFQLVAISTFRSCASSTIAWLVAELEIRYVPLCTDVVTRSIFALRSAASRFRALKVIEDAIEIRTPSTVPAGVPGDFPTGAPPRVAGVSAPDLVSADSNCSFIVLTL